MGAWLAQWIVNKTDPKNPRRLRAYNRVWLYLVLPAAVCLGLWKLVTGGWPWR